MIAGLWSLLENACGAWGRSGKRPPTSHRRRDTTSADHASSDLNNDYQGGDHTRCNVYHDANVR